MKKITYRVEVILLVLWIPCVVLLFKLIPEKKVASVFTGVGFIALPTLFLINEWLRKKAGSTFSKIYILINMEFLLVLGLPIFLLRVFNWNSEFSQLSFMGVPAENLHKFSNANYMLVLLSAMWLAFKEWKNEKSRL